MKFLFHTHSLVSDWNHGNAHFLRGVMKELIRRGHQARALEPKNGWSRQNLLADQGDRAIGRFEATFPTLQSATYDTDFRHEEELENSDVVIVHEWTEPALIARIGRARQEGGRFTLLFHDTHHRSISAEGEIAGLDLTGYDGVLAFGETIRQRYLAAGWGRQVFTWHEAADTDLFHPMPDIRKTGDLIWIGNWGDNERSAEITEFLVEPARRLGLSTTVRGVRYPAEALALLRRAGILYRGWIANAEVPRAFAQNRVTIHIPRRPYVEGLPGIPTIRMFEALACGVPLISAPWDDCEELFRPGRDFLFARHGEEMRQRLETVLSDRDLAASMVESGLETIRARHTCGHRVDELLAIVAGLGKPATSEEAAE